MTDVVVSRFDGAAAEWDGFVRTQPGWTLFHLHGWREIVGRALGHECVYLIARDNGGRAVGVLPLVRVRSLVFGHFLVSMPFVNQGGPIGSEEACRALVAEASRIANTDRVKLLELRSRTPLPSDLPVSHRKVTVVLDMPRDADTLMKSFPAKVRSQVKRPKKDGVVVRIGRDQVSAFYSVFARHMRDLGTPVMPRAFFDAIVRVFPDDVRVAVAYLNDAPIAGGLGLLSNGEFEITWASSLRSHSAMSPNMLVYWEMMAATIQSGARIFNFGRCTRGSGTYRFKMQWGGREEALWWYQLARGVGAGENAATPSPDRPGFALAARLWRRLPLSLANALGPSIVRFIP